MGMLKKRQLSYVWQNHYVWGDTAHWWNSTHTLRKRWWWTGKWDTKVIIPCKHWGGGGGGGLVVLITQVQMFAEKFAVHLLYGNYLRTIKCYVFVFRFFDNNYYYCCIQVHVCVCVFIDTCNTYFKSFQRYWCADIVVGRTYSLSNRTRYFHAYSSNGPEQHLYINTNSYKYNQSNLIIKFINSVIVTGRHRHRNQMLPMMLFGITALGVITVPMGFQMLAIVAGKALLLAKMALLLASMNGLKRVF